MHRRILMAALALMGVCAVGAPAAASAANVATPDVTLHERAPYEAKYLTAYHEAARKLGVNAVGRNLVWDGVVTKGDAHPAARQRVVTSTERLIAMVAPPEPVTAVQSYTATDTATTTAAPVTSTGGYAIPDYIVACESGGDYAAQNASGAYGAYQIMPETAEAYGCDLSSAEGQDSCAGEIYAAEGAAPWDCG